MKFEIGSTGRMALFAVGVAMLAGVAGAEPAEARTKNEMRSDCAEHARAWYHDLGAKVDTEHKGRQTDKTHLIEGRIFLENRSEDFACVYGAGTKWMMQFATRGKSYDTVHNRTPAPEKRPQNQSKAFTVRGLSSGDRLNVRSGPSTNDRIVGALVNGDRVRNLGCRDAGKSRWCYIEMGDDMRSKGWVNRRYLKPVVAAAKPANPAKKPAVDTGRTNTVRINFPSGMDSSTVTDTLAPGASTRFVLGAERGQDLRVRFLRSAAVLEYQIFNPDRSFLVGQSPARNGYEGQLWQSGDHVIEVINRAKGNVTYEVDFSIK